MRTVTSALAHKMVGIHAQETLRWSRLVTDTRQPEMVQFHSRRVAYWGAQHRTACTKRRQAGNMISIHRREANRYLAQRDGARADFHLQRHLHWIRVYNRLSGATE